MQSDSLTEKVNAFWKWFAENEHMFKEIEDADGARDAMDNQILEFGMFSWEISEGFSRPFSLTISPNRDRKRLEISYQIIQAAPDMSDWEFHYCKSPKAWDYSIEMYDQFMVKQRFDVSEWEYALLHHPKDNIEIIICANNLSKMDVDDRLDAGEIALVNILGEELVIEHLCALEVVAEFEDDHKSIRKKIGHLKTDFESAANTFKTSI